MGRPIAYFITFHTFGSWLHGRATGSVDPQHNEWGAPFLEASAEREEEARGRMQQPAITLEDAQRSVVLRTICEVCQYRRWRLLAAHVRTNHVHVIVTAAMAPERVMSDLKAWCTRRLREAGLLDEAIQVWSKHGSTVYLWKEETVAEKIEYVLHGQGTYLPNSVYPETGSTASDPASHSGPRPSEPGPSEPRP